MAESLVFLGVRQSPVGDDDATVYGQYTVVRFNDYFLLIFSISITSSPIPVRITMTIS